MGLSVVVLTHNNAETVSVTLKSLAFADEVVVIDDDSTDKTVAIARKSGAVVYSHGIDDDFATQRNYGLSKATHEWVLFIDSDEVVSKKLAQEILSATGRIDVNGFYLKRQDVMWGRELRWGETQSVRLLRLARVGKGVWKRPVHETWEVFGIVGTLTHPLHHFPHPDVAQFLADINRYSTINARHLKARGVRVNAWHIIVYPGCKFIHNYIIRKGFLDGMPGLIMALMMSFHSFLTRAKLWHRLSAAVR